MAKIKNNTNYLSTYKNLKVLVTGSTGFKGSWLCFWLNLINARVIGVGLKPEKGSIIFRSLNLQSKIKQHFVDITNFKKINKIIKKEKPDIIFHLAAQSIVSLSYLNPLKTLSTNILGSANILESIRVNKISHLVYITSDKCYLNVEKNVSYKETDLLGGMDNYSSSKAAAELIFKSYFKSFYKNKFLSIATARAGNVIGGGDLKENRIVPDIIKAIQLKKNINIRSPNSTRPWQHVLEPLSGYLKLGSKLIKKEIRNNKIPSWNFGPYKHNCKRVILIVKKILIFWGAEHKKITINANSKFKESKLLSLNINKAKRELKWIPQLTLDESLKLTVDWYKDYYNKNSNIIETTKNQIKYYTKKIQ